MTETLGSLCDKLTIVILKECHTASGRKLAHLADQKKQLQGEMDHYFIDAISGRIPVSNLTFAANKVYKKEGNELKALEGKGIPYLISELATTNCALWHEQEKIYDFEHVLPENKDRVVKQLALLNLKRNQCIDAIDRHLQLLVVVSAIRKTPLEEN